MATEQDLIKQELLYAREIRRTFERAIAGINPLKKVILSRIGKGAAIKTRIQKRTSEIYLLGKGTATVDIRQSLKKLSAAKIDDEILLEPFEDELVDAYTAETLGYMDYFAKDLQDEFNITLREGYMLGESIPELSKRIADTWKVNKVRATRFARTQTNEVYNAAHTVTYLTEPAIENIQFIAHLDSRTSAICRFYDGTIWRKDDPSIQRPPLHFNCRSRIVAYPYDYPGDRDFTKQTDGTKVTKKYGKSIDAQVTNFRTKYWKPAKVEIPEDLIAKGLITRLSEERIKALDYPADKDEIRDRYFDTVIKPDLNLDIDVAESVEKYTGNDYRLFNTYLRDPKASLSEYGPVIDYEDMIEGAIKNIDSIMDRVSLEKDIIMHRGITPNRAEALLKSGQITDAAYGSTSESIGTALHFTTKGAIDLDSKAFQNIIVVQGKKGSKGIHYGGGESEILLPRGTTYTVTGTREVEELTFKTRFGGGGTLPIRFIYCSVT